MYREMSMVQLRIKSCRWCHMYRNGKGTDTGDTGKRTEMTKVQVLR